MRLVEKARLSCKFYIGKVYNGFGSKKAGDYSFWLVYSLISRAF